MKKNKFSIIIPVAPKASIEVLKSIRELAYPSQAIETLAMKGGNPSVNRNNGVMKSKFEFVAFVNAHSIVEKDWLMQTSSFFDKHPEIDIIGGPQLTSKNEGFFGQASGLALSSIFGSGGIYKRYSLSNENLNANETSITSANLVCRKKVFSKIKFDKSIYPGEDPKFIEDAINSGFKVAYSPKIRVYNFRRTNISGLFKQIFNYGKTRPKKESLLTTIKRPFFLIPSLFIIYLLVLPSLTLISSLFLLPLFIYIILNLLFSLKESLKVGKVTYLFILPIIFLLIHLSYGLGFLYGLLISKSRAYNEKS